MIFDVIGYADQEIPTLSLVSGIIRLPSGWDFSVCTTEGRQFLFIQFDQS